MNTSILKDYGLNRNDITVYDTLLRLGRTKTGKIIGESKVVSSRVYESLRILISKGLVSYQVRNNIKYYQAELPEQLIKGAEKNIEILKSLSNSIAVTPITHQDRSNSNVYEGRHGFKMAFTQHIEKLKKDEDVMIIAFSRRSYTKTKGSIELREYFKQSDTLIAPKGANIRLLCEKEMLGVVDKERVNPNLYQKKYLPSGYFGPTAINISDSEVLISVWGDNPIVFSIKDTTVVNGFKKNFEFLWGIGKQ